MVPVEVKGVFSYQLSPQIKVTWHSGTNCIRKWASVSFNEFAELSDTDGFHHKLLPVGYATVSQWKSRANAHTVKLACYKNGSVKTFNDTMIHRLI